MSDREITITRLVPAPRTLVFAAWTQPEHLSRWFNLSPKGFTVTGCDIDVQPGGRFYIGHRAPDGADYPFKGVYREVAAPERLVYTDEWEADGVAHEALVTVTFEEQDGQTLLTITTRFESTEQRDWAAAQGFLDGWAEFLDAMQRCLPAA